MQWTRTAWLGCALLLVAACDDDAPTTAADDAPNREPYHLQAPVEVLVDDWGNSHVYAGSKFDASFVQCYRAAHDRLFQMDYLIRYVIGRLSEWYGDDELLTDQQRRVVGFERIGRATYAWMQQEHPEVAEKIAVCADGINAYIDDAAVGRNGARLERSFASIDPAYVPPHVDPAWIVAFGKGQAFELSFSGEIEFAIWLLNGVLGEELFGDILRFQPMVRNYILPEPERARYGFEPLPADRVPGEPDKPAAADAPRPSLGPLAGTLSTEQLAAIVDALQTIRPGNGGPSRGSNNWVVHGSRTDTGRPMLANDPHLGLDLPANFLETHLVYPDGDRQVNVTGIMLAGGPGVLIGHNDHVAWGLTTTFGDVTDLYEERLSPDGARVWRDGRWQPLDIVYDPICVRPDGGAVADCRRVPFEVKLVPGRGPLFNQLLGPAGDVLPPLSMRWVGFEPTGELVAVDKINAAQSLDEMFERLEFFHVGQQNFAMFDTRGDIGYLAPTKLPIRDWNLQAAPPYAPLPGDGHDWAGFHAYSVLPQARNPQQGFVATANQDPFGTTDDNDPLDDALYFGHFYDSGMRGEQIRRRLEAAAADGGGVSFEEMQAIQGDVHSILAQRMLPHLLAAAPDDCHHPAPAEPQTCAAIAILEAWDYSNDLSSPAPSLFHLWYAHLARETFRDDLPFWALITDLFGSAAIEAYGRPLLRMLEGHPAPSGRNYFDRAETPAVEGAADIVRDALRLAIAQGKDEFRDESGGALAMDDWTWDRFHVVHFQHLAFGEDPTYGRGPFANDGGRGNPDASDWALFDAGDVVGPAQGAVQRGGPNMRMVVTHRDGAWRMVNAIPGGASGDPDDRHYDDQLTLWLNNEARAIPYTRAEVEAAAETRLSFPTGFPRRGAVGSSRVP